MARVMKMTGKYKPRTTPCIIHNNNTISDPTEVANILAQHYENVSNGLNRTVHFRRTNNILESQHRHIPLLIFLIFLAAHGCHLLFVPYCAPVNPDK